MATSISGSTITFDDATTQSTTGVEFAAGTLMLFQQTAAPTGWTKQTTHNNKALRVVSGNAGSGGTTAFTTVFAAGLTSDATTLSTSQIPSHTHAINYASSQHGPYPGNFGSGASTFNSQAAGGGGSHTHTMSLAVQYVDLIIASKN